jgi:hypothetical protein
MTLNLNDFDVLVFDIGKIKLVTHFFFLGDCVVCFARTVLGCAVALIGTICCLGGSARPSGRPAAGP